MQIPEPFVILHSFIDSAYKHNFVKIDFRSRRKICFHYLFYSTVCGTVSHYLSEMSEINGIYCTAADNEYRNTHFLASNISFITYCAHQHSE